MERLFFWRTSWNIAGISYLMKIGFKAEYDSTEIPIQEGFPIRSSDYTSIEFLNLKIH